MLFPSFHTLISHQSGKYVVSESLLSYQAITLCFLGILCFLQLNYNTDDQDSLTQEAKQF